MIRVSATMERLKGSLWVLPSFFVIVALVAGTVLSQVRPAGGSVYEALVFGGTASSARQILSVIAGAMITVTGLTFSLTVVALQMAASQYSPRVLRGFLADRGNQLVLSAFLATFAYCVAVIRVIRDEAADGGVVLPNVAVTGGIVLTLVSIAALVYFIHHLTQQLRVETIMAEVEQLTLRAIDHVHPDDGASGAQPVLARPDGPVHTTVAKRSGYLQSVDVDGIVSAARKRDLVVRLRPSIGEHVTSGTTLAWMWSADGVSAPAGTDDADSLRALDHVAHGHVHLGRERTMQQDVRFGIRQLVDIAAKALSPGINDPTTAVGALGHLSVIVCRLAGRTLDRRVAVDDRGQVRAVVPWPRLDDYLASVCDQPRRYGAGEPAVVLALLSLLTDVAEVVTTEQARALVLAECERTVELAGQALDATDMTRVLGAADLCRRTLEVGERPYPPDVD